MSKFNVFTVDAVLVQSGQTTMRDYIRREGTLDGFDTKAEAETLMHEMQAEARAHGHSDYADRLFVDSLE